MAAGDGEKALKIPKKSWALAGTALVAKGRTTARATMLQGLTSIISFGMTCPSLWSNVAKVHEFPRLNSSS
jgi:hypothetical protein